MRLSPVSATLLVIPPLLWSCNIVLGRMIAPLISPVTLNLLRWFLAFLLLLPLAGGVLRRGSDLWPQWRRFAWLSLFSIGAYNALQYQALTTSTAINVTLVGASTPVWMLVIGRVLFGVRVSGRQAVGAALSIGGVAVVLGRGDWQTLQQFRMVPGDLYMMAASMAWAYYSWLLAHPTPESAGIRARWSYFLLAQMVFGLAWSSLFAGAEWLLTPAHVEWSLGLAAALLFIALGPSLLAFASWGAGVARAGPAVAGFFVNLTPLFTAVLSSLFLGEHLQAFHALAFVLLASGIVLSTPRRGH